MDAEDRVRQLGKGALESPPDPRDLKLSFLAGAVPPIDWSREFRLPEPPDTNQASADDCVAEATSHYHWQLTGRRFSVRSVFAYIAQGYGAYLRDGPARVVSHGQETFAEAPDPQPKTMQNMRSKAGLNPPDALDDRELRYFDTGGSAEQVAQAVRDWRGCLIGLQMTARGWQDMTNPRPPLPNEGGEGHCLYAFGYHLHDGLKCIVAKSSWCGAQPGHHEHHIKENYFASGYVFANAHVLVPKEKLTVYQRYIVFDEATGREGVLVVRDTGFSDAIVWAKSEAMLAELKREFEVPDSAPRIVLPRAA